MLGSLQLVLERMSTLQSEVYEAFAAIGVPEENPIRAAEALIRRDQTVTNVGLGLDGLRADVQTFKAETIGQASGVERELQQLRADSAVLKWMKGFVPAMLLAVMLKLFH